MDHHTGLLAPNFCEIPHQAAAVKMKLQVRLALTQDGPELVEEDPLDVMFAIMG